MYLKKLAIYESHPVGKLIREVNFTKGANFIVDGHKKPGEKGNGIGKTTVLRVIDICLGAKDKKYLYFDEELGATNTVLKNYINDSKVYAELTLWDELDTTEPTVKNVIRVELFERGRRFINGEAQNQNDFYALLNEIIFDNEINTPTFRQLIGMFVRIKMKDDNNKFLKYLDNFSSTAEYENIFNFLFRLSDQAVSDAVLNYKSKIASLTTNINQLFSINGIKSINAIEQKIIEVHKEIQAVRRQISSLIDADELKRNEEDVSHVREQYARIANSIDLYRFKLDRTNEILRDAKAEGSKKIDLDVLKNIFEDTKSNFEGLAKTFDELVAFNNQLLTNKVAYFEKQQADLLKGLEGLSTEREQLFNRYRDVVLLIKNNDVEGYVKLQASLEEKTNNLGRLEKIQELHEELSSAKEDAEGELAKLEKIPKVDPKTSLSEFNDFFTPYSKAITDESYLLYKTDSGFPLALDNVESGFSTGTKKSAIAAFDLAYQSYAEKNSIAHPKFIIHDVIETMDTPGLTNTIKIARQIGCQYIVAVLKDKIENNDSIDDADVKLMLTKSDKFFRV